MNTRVQIGSLQRAWPGHARDGGLCLLQDSPPLVRDALAQNVLSHDIASRRVLLVGASGRVGRMVLHHWRNGAGEGLAPVAQYRRDDAGAGLLWSPLDGPRALHQRVRRDGPLDAMVMLAGLVPGKARDFALDADLAEACLDAARESGINRVLIVSSSAVYGARAGAPFREADLPQPTSAYGAGKLAMERRCAERAASGVDLCFLRLGNVAGADALLSNLSALAPGEPAGIDCFADGRGPIRSYIGAGTLARVLGSLLRASDPLPRHLNIGAPTPVSMTDLARAAGQSFRPRPSTDTPQRLTLDCGRLARLHDFTPADADPRAMVAQWRATMEIVPRVAATD